MLHLKKNYNDHVHGSEESSGVLAKFKMPKNEMSSREAYDAIHNELALDGNASLNLATFVQTWHEEEIHKLMDECIIKNMIDKDEYPQTSEIESRCVHILADLWNSPESAETIGTSTTGSSEAAMLGGLAMLWNWREKMKAQNKPTLKPNMVTGAVQVCWEKFARYWDIELRQIPMKEDRYTMSPEDVLEYVDENTICVVVTLGLTFTLEYEPVLEISKALDILSQNKNIDIPIHVDGASGGFLAPFIKEQKKLIWDFQIERVKSINASGHKFGLAPVGVGWVVWRDKKNLPAGLIFNVNYLGGNMPTFALNFSRPGGQIIAQYYNFIRLGVEGYSKIQNNSAEVGKWLASELKKLDIFKIIYNGTGGIPGCTWTLTSDAKVNFDLYDLAKDLRSRGWLIPAYSLPENATDIVVQRILVKQNFTKDMASLLMEDMKRSIDHFKKNSTGSDKKEKESAFNHS